MTLTWLGSHSLVILLLFYSATKKVRLILHDDTLGAIVRGMYLSWCGAIATPVTSRYLNFWYLEHSPSLRQQ